MELNNEIDVNAPIQEVWEAFNTPERIAPCLPGAELQEVDGNNFNGLVKIKVGPITCLLYTSPSPRDNTGSRMPSSA